MKTAIALLATAAVVAAAGSVAAQDASLTPNFGETTLRAGFTPDPHDVQMVAGGDIDASSLGSSCVGMITDAPDYRVHYTAESGVKLTFRASASDDVTLVINGPDGRFSCNDDAGSSTNAGIVYRTPRSGQYDVWVGTFGKEPTDTRLRITELE
jgi:hypothetical protein